MKQTKIANYLKTGILFISVCLLLWNCQKNDILEEVNQLSVPNIEDSKSAFLSNKKLSKGTNSFLSKVNWDDSSEILYKEDIKVLNSPLNINSNKIKSFVASVEKDGKIENKIITLVFDDDSNNEYFSGKLLIHNGDGSYDKGFKYEKGKNLGVYKINTSAYKNKGSCTAVTLTAGELIMLFEAGMLDGTETNIFGCEVEIESVGNDDTGGDNDDVYWDWPDNDFNNDGPHGSGSSWWTPPTPCEAALLSRDVYNTTNGQQEKGTEPLATELSGDWSLNTTLDLSDITLTDNATGFNSAVYQKQVNGVYQYMYVTEGTSPLSVQDWINNMKQISGSSKQYEISVKNAKALNDLVGNGQLYFTGHSLGGGLASANALATGRNAYTYNAAGLSSSTKSLYDKGLSPYISATIVKGEILDKIQSKYGIKAEGTIKYIAMESSFWQDFFNNMSLALETYNSGRLHTIDAVINILDCE